MRTLQVLLVAVAVAASWAVPIDPEEEAILRELQEATLVSVDNQDIFGDSDEDDVRTMKDVIDKLKNDCKCEDNACSCCGEPKLYGLKIPACVNMTMFPAEKVFQLSASVADNIFMKNVSVGKLEEVCHSLPGRLSSVSFCMHNSWDETAEEGMVSCTSMEAKFRDTVVATLKFGCLQFKDKSLNFIEPKENGKNSLVAFQIKNPIEKLIEFFKRRLA